MEAANITRDTPNPSGGEILKDASGAPTGLLRETAQQLANRAHDAYLAKRTPEQAAADLRKVIGIAAKECLSKGITTFEDAGSPLTTADMFRAMAEHNELPLRLWVMLRGPNDLLAKNLDRYRTLDVGQNHLAIRAIKRYMDGALGSRGAWLLAPYTDKPESTGLNVEDPADIRAAAELAIAHDYQLCVHAIGDRANREVLNIYESVFREHPEKKDLRWRIEHAQHIDPADIPRFGQLGVIAAMQAIHCTSDAPYVLLRLGPKRAEEGAYVWQKLMKSGAVVGNGTDAPVEDVSPIACYYAAVSRRLKDGTTFYPRPAHVAAGGPARLHLEQRLRRVSGEAQGLAGNRQAGGRHCAFERHPDHSGRSNSRDRREIYDRRREELCFNSEAFIRTSMD